MLPEKYSEVVHRCFRCGYCKFTGGSSVDDEYILNCPAYKKWNFQTYSPGGKMWLIYAVINNELEWSKNLANIIYSCTTCGNCMEHCPFEFHEQIVDIFEAAREQLFFQELAPEKFRQFGEHIAKEHNPYIENHKDRLNWLPKDAKISKTAEVGYFVGCTASYRQTKIAQDTVKILNKLGIEFQILGEEWCCGSPLLRTGQTKSALEQAKHNIEKFEEAGIKQLITSCAGCYRTLKEDYPKKFELNYNFEILHLTEYLEKNLDKLEIKQPLNKTVTYHDPCHLGRHTNLYEPPRVILQKFPEINFIEMKKNRRDATCCGAGGGVKSEFSEWSLEMARDRILEAKEIGAEILVSTCPFCNRNFHDAKNEFNLDIEIYDLTELLLKYLI
jgi:heterodisulfide reductase subunit D